MSLTLREVNEIFLETKQGHRNAKINPDLARKIIGDKLNVDPESLTFSKDVKNLNLRCARLRDKINHNRLDIDLEEIVLKRLDYINPIPKSEEPIALSIVNPNIPKRKSLDDLKKADSKRVRLHSTGIMEAISNLACSEGISIIQYVGLILYFFAIVTPGCQNIAKIAKRISEGDNLEDSQKIVPTDKCTFLAYNLSLGKMKWTDLRYFLISEGLKLATWPKIRDFRATLIPPFQLYPSVSNPIGVTISYTDHIVKYLLDSTSNSI